MSTQGSVPPQLDPNSLYTDQERRDALKLRTYNNILAQIHNKIRVLSRLPNNDKTLLFSVPDFVMGVPRFSTRDCILYAVWNLRQTNFDVQYVPPNVLFISWKRHDTLYKEEKNPIVQSMKNAIQYKEQQKHNEEEKPVKPVLKKTTQTYIPVVQETTKKVTFV